MRLKSEGKRFSRSLDKIFFHSYLIRLFFSVLGFNIWSVDNRDLYVFSELPNAQGIGIDRSEAALRVARDNLSRLGLRDRVCFLCADWMSATGGVFDVIVCNPPYIAPSEIRQLDPEVRNHDPYSALDGGEDGMDAYRTVIPQALGALGKGGLAVFEAGCSQGDAVAGLIRLSTLYPTFSSVRVLRDLGGTGRAVAAVRQS